MIVEVRGLVKQYKKKLVLNGINIQIDSPQIIALVGPKGSGKTTLMNCLMNLLPFKAGTITIVGKRHTDPLLFREVAYMQDYRLLYNNLTGNDHLRFICGVQKIPTSRVKEVAEYLGMQKYLKKRVRSYSLAMKQHLLLAMAIIHKPKLLLLDEPLIGLDATSAAQLLAILQDLHAQGTTILISSPNLDDMDKLTNTIYFMKDGQLLKESLQDYATERYLLTVSDVEKAISVLSEQLYEYTLEGQSIVFDETKKSLQSIITLLNQQDVQIDKIDNYKLGPERRYMELYESEVSR